MKERHYENLKAFVACVLVLTLVSGVFPANLLDQVFSVQRAEAAVPPVTPDLSWGEYLAATETTTNENRTKTSGHWQYAVVDNSKGYAVVTGYIGDVPSALKVPDQLDGFDTIGIASSLSAGISGVSSIEVPGNVMAIGDSAFPRGT